MQHKCEHESMRWLKNLIAPRRRPDDRRRTTQGELEAIVIEKYGHDVRRGDLIVIEGKARAGGKPENGDDGGRQFERK